MTVTLARYISLPLSGSAAGRSASFEAQALQCRSCTEGRQRKLQDCERDVVPCACQLSIRQTYLKRMSVLCMQFNSEQVSQLPCELKAAIGNYCICE